MTKSEIEAMLDHRREYLEKQVEVHQDIIDRLNRELREINNK